MTQQLPCNPPPEPEKLISLIREKHQHIKECQRLQHENRIRMLNTANEAGQLLIALKQQVAHGEWMKRIKEDLKFGQKTADEYMRIARNWEWIKAKMGSDSNFTYTQARREITEQNQQNKLQGNFITSQKSPFVVHVDEFDIFLRETSKELANFQKIQFKGTDVKKRMKQRSLIAKMLLVQQRLEEQIKRFEDL